METLDHSCASLFSRSWLPSLKLEARYTFQGRHEQGSSRSSNRCRLHIRPHHTDEDMVDTQILEELGGGERRRVRRDAA